MRVFKFGGASVNSADAIRNVATIVKQHHDSPLVVVVSAMGKTTNLLEKIVPGVTNSGEEREALIQQSYDYHIGIACQLFGDKDNNTVKRLEELFEDLRKKAAEKPKKYNFDYDQIVSYGEILSTTLISGYLNSVGISNRWVDVRQIVRTDENYREGNVDFDATRRQADSVLSAPCHDDSPQLIITQGFIAGTAAGTTTTLGREGSDYSASILSYCLDAESMTIWKDVPGFLNADPKFFPDTVKIDKIPYNEAIELAYYGASVIHPKTVKPIQNKGIKLYIKSFVDPAAAGSVIGPYDGIEPQTPLYIFKNSQTLVSVQPKDFSFIAEDNLQNIFHVLAQLNIRVNMMQNSALSFSFCIDNNEVLFAQLRERLEQTFRLRYNTDLQLITIRYCNQAIIDRVVDGRRVLLQQRSRNTTQILVEN